jgi:hypothetical protein
MAGPRQVCYRKAADLQQRAAARLDAAARALACCSARHALAPRAAWTTDAVRAALAAVIAACAVLLLTVHDPARRKRARALVAGWAR